MQAKAGDNRPALTNDLLDKAAENLAKHRDNNTGDSPKPGLAEYLDLLRGLDHLAPNDHELQQQWLDRVYRFAYQKHVTSR